MLFHTPPLSHTLGGDVGTDVTVQTDLPFSWALWLLQAQPQAEMRRGRCRDGCGDAALSLSEMTANALAVV